MVQKPFGKNKGKNKPSFSKPVKSTTFKKKKPNKVELGCFICGELGHFSKDCPDRADRRGKKGSKSVNVVTTSNTDGYGILLTVLSVFQTPCWWIDTGANVHVCSGISVLMENGSHASVLCVGTVDLKFTSGKIMQLRKV